MTAKEKRRGKGKGCLIALLIVVLILVVGGGIGWWLFAREHREAASLPLDAVDFGKLDDGTYHGLYEGGMYRWRRNECVVMVTDGKVTAIQFAGSEDPGAENTKAEMLYDRVIEAQSLQVDTISSATLTSKAYLQCVENALVQAQHR